MTPSAFVEALMPYARQVEAVYGLDAWAILTQWADETGWGTSALFVSGHNLAGVTHTDARTGDTVFSTYATLQDGVNAYIQTLGLSYYVGVRATAGQSVPATLTALGQSRWDAGRYGNPPGSNLLAIWQNTLAPLAGQTGGVGDPTSLYTALWASIVHLMGATGTQYLPAPWASTQNLTGEHLGTIPSVADGANYCATMLQEVAIHEAAPNPVTGVTGAPAGSTDPAAALGPVYVALVHVAQSMGTGLLGLPWASAQGLTPDHWGHPPSLDAGVSYLQGQVDALTRYAGGNLYVVPPPAGAVGSVTTPVTAASTPAGASVALPTPPASSGTGQAGAQSAWQQLMGVLGTSLPAAVDRLSVASNPGTTYEGPH